MRKILFILFFLPQLLFATNYYVAPDGNDNDPGTITHPWGTWGKGFNTAQAGDTVFFRGGVYYRYSAGSYSPKNSGTVGNRIVFINYPGEKPILDCGNYRPPTSANSGIVIAAKNYIDIVGLEIRKILQKIDGDVGTDYKGIYAYNCNEVRLINCVIHEVPGFAFDIVYLEATGQPYKKTYVINCDAYDIIDTLSPIPYVGGTGSGFGGGGLPPGREADGLCIFYGCRAWNCSDQGFAVSLDGPSIVDSCWSFANGQDLGPGDSGDGIGFKFGWAQLERDMTMRKITRCISAYNDSYGYGTNDNGYKSVPMEIYNNISYKDDVGFRVWETTSPAAERNKRVFRNNIGHSSTRYPFWEQEPNVCTHSNNTWDSPVTVTDVDFEALPSSRQNCLSILSAPRKPDGSLPDIGNYFKLAPTSDLIDAGMDVGLPYNGSAPDMGAFEFDEFPPISEPFINTNEPILAKSREMTAGGNMIYDGGGTISAKGVVYAETTNPTLSDNVMFMGTGTAYFICVVKGLKGGTKYYIRAFATNETGTAYGANVEIETPEKSPVSISGRLLQHKNNLLGL